MVILCFYFWKTADCGLGNGKVVDGGGLWKCVGNALFIQEFETLTLFLAININIRHLLNYFLTTDY